MQKAARININENMLYLYEKYKSVFRFMAVGCLNTSVDFLTFTMMHSLFGVDKLICQITGYSAGVINSFILNKLWTFENKGSNLNTAFQVVRFAAINLISLGISLIGLKYINEYFGVNIYVSKLIVTGIAQAVNYFGYKFWVFNSKCSYSAD